MVKNTEHLDLLQHPPVRSTVCSLFIGERQIFFNIYHTKKSYAKIIVSLISIDERDECEKEYQNVKNLISVFIFETENMENEICSTSWRKISEFNNSNNYQDSVCMIIRMYKNYAPNAK